jgi:hypothetical protein
MFYVKPFSCDPEMIDTHERMFGEAGRVCAEIICKHAGVLFDEPLDPYKIRMVLAPVELGPYNRHYGYTYESADAFHLILGNRHICRLDKDGVMTLMESKIHVEDFIVHEMTHHRQVRLIGNNGWKISDARACHRDKGWYTAISEAAPRYLGVEFPEAIWPKMISKRIGKRVRKVEDPTRISEVEACHWPDSFRKLKKAGDKRLCVVH